MFNSEIAVINNSIKYMNRKTVSSDQLVIIYKMSKLRFYW